MSENINLNTVWKSILGELQIDVSRATYSTFVTQIKLLEINNGIAKIACNNSFTVSQVETKYYNLIQNLLKKHTQQQLSILFTVDPSQFQNKQPLTDLPLFATSHTNQSPAQHNDTTLQRNFQTANLHPQFIFDTFAVGSTNQLAYAAAEAVARTPGQAYNPLFIWGGTGVGKSHLMQAIGHTISKKQPDSKILFSAGEDFTNEIISAIREKNTMKFKQKYRSINVLLLDDIQFLAGKDTAQEEFFHTFNAIHRAGGQIVMTADRPPTELTRLEDRLRSRFQAGLIVDIGEPDFELRTAILLIKSKLRGIDLPMDLAQKVSEYIKSARELEGFLMKLQAALLQQNRQLDQQLIAELLGNISLHENQLKRGIRPIDIIKATADYFGLKVNQLKNTRRQAHLVKARQIAQYILRKDLNLQQEAIGELFNRDHTTILHAVDKIDKLLGKTPELNEHISGIRQMLR